MVWLDWFCWGDCCVWFWRLVGLEVIVFWDVVLESLGLIFGELFLNDIKNLFWLLEMLFCILFLLWDELWIFIFEIVEVFFLLMLLLLKVLEEGGILVREVGGILLIFVEGWKIWVSVWLGEYM